MNSDRQCRQRDPGPPWVAIADQGASSAVAIAVPVDSIRFDRHRQRFPTAPCPLRSITEPEIRLLGPR